MNLLHYNLNRSHETHFHAAKIEHYYMLLLIDLYSLDYSIKSSIFCQHDLFFQQTCFCQVTIRPVSWHWTTRLSQRHGPTLIYTQYLIIKISCIVGLTPTYYSPFKVCFLLFFYSISTIHSSRVVVKVPKV